MPVMLVTETVSSTIVVTVVLVMPVMLVTETVSSTVVVTVLC